MSRSTAQRISVPTGFYYAFWRPLGFTRPAAIAGLKRKINIRGDFTLGSSPPDGPAWRPSPPPNYCTVAPSPPANQGSPIALQLSCIAPAGPFRLNATLGGPTTERNPPAGGRTTPPRPFNPHLVVWKSGWCGNLRHSLTDYTVLYFWIVDIHSGYLHSSRASRRSVPSLGVIESPAVAFTRSTVSFFFSLSLDNSVPCTIFILCSPYSDRYFSSYRLSSRSQATLPTPPAR